MLKLVVESAIRPVAYCRVHETIIVACNGQTKHDQLLEDIVVTTHSHALNCRFLSRVGHEDCVVVS